MPAPSQLSIATSALNRLVKEKASYHKEFEQQQATIAKLEAEQSTSEDENAEYTLRQERKALEETKAMFPQLKTKIEDTKAKLETQLVSSLVHTQANSDQSAPEDVAKAHEAVAAAEAAIKESS
ncbi:tubulin-specific chaperone Rbl2 like protein [Zymoseptoria brevis]|uniref:Tubulin-specific chaperone A n=1 Tax=Zymoseptoria brevis TaxID=1047168 RepID=A0A0F4GEF6_9PEZI|nr:tubulin-specific chaperone Rbl2 like protein [Zymoseptoria brevis]